MKVPLNEAANEDTFWVMANQELSKVFTSLMNLRKSVRGVSRNRQAMSTAKLGYTARLEDLEVELTNILGDVENLAAIIKLIRKHE